MLVLILAYLGGVLTILSPCILPVLPFVFARSDRPFMRNGLPMLLGMAITFAAVATLAALGGGWAVHANQYGRYVAMLVLAFLGLTLLSTRLAEWITRPFVALGNRLSQRSAGDGDSVWAAAGLGVATGLLWAPCAGPILGLLLTGAALNGASVHTTLLLLTYAAGAATSLGLALLIGGKVFALMKRSLGAGEWMRRALGVLVLCGVAAIALGLDTGLLTRVSLASTGGIEQKLINAVRPAPAPQPVLKAGEPLPVEGTLPSLAGATQWLNSPPLTTEALRGKVVLVDFWTYSCINCIRALPYVRGWADKYKDHGLVVIGVHAPEFAFEKDPANVTKAVKDLGVDYPVALDNDYAIWKGFNNEYWPAHYFIDAQGQIRHHHFGEGEYRESEDVIRQLLADAGQKNLPGGYVSDDHRGVEAAASDDPTRSPETYVGYARAMNFVGGRVARDEAHDYHAPASLAVDQWSLDGRWTVRDENAQLERAGGRIVYRFRGRDLHLVLGPAADGKPIRYRVSIDGKPPGADHGMDTDADGHGTITSQRLYQLVRQAHGSGERLFEIEFLDPGVQAYAFTFG
ncbi:MULTISPECIES: cytochrome c biogenesis protein DipZ [Rhodanobacter]|uniref:cytochrome c biogenesis protein DipZ n=1 Tax=Rhodanobacter TaxID=75309 RepID=UPI0004011604|nr:MULTISPECIES: cytochrome c biogenesis protein DipZ [Rhodanobacter]UJJ49960.1 cytochrome c biogenesis protein DipZ [Rhodanobacter denitrificans]UJJ57848.1 cytochrome c biogenesis protein DipZ [Rhodanobacter denitrificans]UJM92674.1 cytochrome c biogenesis protein DipZ [Rhodanobacter denitrificans]UJM96204.1 cytochrome c biogenesis protein DipZ [Rhodanobacter denitrificans]UJN20965.1 cytochrome c biogenesis protein DipZ [Rhodanobacter denitrificans]